MVRDQPGTKYALKVYNDAEKVFTLHKLPVGLVTCGLAIMGNRTIESFIREFELKHEQGKCRPLTLEDLSALLHSFLAAKYEKHLGKLIE